MIELLAGATLTLISLLVGYSLGKNQAITPPDITKKINKIFNRVVPDKNVGEIERPTALDNFYRDHPDVRQEHEVMAETFNNLNIKI